MDESLPIETKLTEATSVAGGPALARRGLDLVVTRVVEKPLLRNMLPGETAEKTARHSPASVLLVTRYEGTVKSLSKTLMG